MQFANTINARKDPAGEYWEAVVKDEAMPQAIQGLVDDASKVTSPTSAQKNHCSTTPTTSRSFQSSPNDDDKLKAKRYFANDFEPRPNASAYADDDDKEEEKSFVKNFESRPYLSAYSDNSDTKKEKSFVKDFEPRPSASAYNDNKEMKEEKSFTKEFEPRPNLSAYEDDAVGVEAIKESH
ncbi:UNVERIFIED_CONTAM: hypothetical protein Sangu_0647900 [Sesamum angustifolium]|uniref:Organ-specific protein S2 n=1 Tax=Sesamum angustifolium TaxID=2727405 RepID=A0AAW2QCL8_9LAMI